MARAVKGAAVSRESWPAFALHIDVGGQGGPDRVVAIGDLLAEPEQFRRGANLVGVLLGAVASGSFGGNGQGLGVAQHHGHGGGGRLFAQGVAFGQGGRKGVFAGGGRLREVPAGPGQGQLHRIGAAVHRGGDAGGQHRNHRVKIHGVFCADAGQGQGAFVKVIRPDPLPGEDGLFRRVLGGIRFLRSISFLHGSGAGGQVRTLRRTDGTVRIDTVRRAKGLTGTFRRTFRFAAVRRVAEFAVRRVKGAGTSLGIAAGLIVDVRTVQFFCDAAAFLAAHMGTGVGCFFFALGREHPVAVTLRRMLMDTLGHEGVTIVGVFVGARRTLGITAGLIVHMMGAYGSPCFHIRSVHRCTGHGKHHGH